MANKRISRDKRALALALLAEGNGVNGTARVLSISKTTLLKLILEVGEACRDWHDRHAVSLECNFVQADELHSYVFCKKEALTAREKARASEGKGDCWTFGAICSETKLAIAWESGPRDYRTARPFFSDLAKRVDGRFQLSTDKFRPYNALVAEYLSNRVDYGQEIKEFGQVPNKRNERFREGVVTHRREAVFGAPEEVKISTAHMERVNLTIRQCMKRHVRRTSGYSKSISHHRAAVDFFFFVYNYVRKSESKAIKGKTPAQAAGICAERMGLEELVDMTDSYWEPKREAERADKAAVKRKAEDALFEAAFSKQAA